MGVLLDTDSKYVNFKAQPHEGGYWRVKDRASGIATANGLIGLHRGVLYESIGDGPHTSALCRQPGLDWKLDKDDPNRLEVDHINSDRSDNRLGNLRPVHKWCNGNRQLMETHGIPFSYFYGTPVTGRIAIRISGGPNIGQLTPAAKKLLAERPWERTETGPEEPLTPVVEEPLDDEPKVRHGLTTWTQVKEGRKARRAPDSLTEKYPFLKEIET